MGSIPRVHVWVSSQVPWSYHDDNPFRLNRRHRQMNRRVKNDRIEGYLGKKGVFLGKRYPARCTQRRLCWKWWEESRKPRRITFGLTDHHVAELALPSFIKALHLNVVGGLWLQVADGVPVSIPWEREQEPHVGMCIWFAWPPGAGSLSGGWCLDWRHWRAQGPCGGGTVKEML